MNNLELNLKLFKSVGSKQFILGLTKDKNYRASILEAIELSSLENWDPLEMSINEKSRFILAFEYDYSDPEDEFKEFPEYISRRLHLYEFSYDEACRFLGEIQLRGYPSSVIGFSLLQDGDCLAARLELGGDGEE